MRDGGQGWLPDNKRIWFLAEHDGWMHLYTVDATRLVAGEEAADDAASSRSTRWSCRADGSTFYFTSTEVHPGERHLYAMSVDGGAADEDHVADRRPPGRDLAGQHDVRTGVVVRRIGRPKCS